MNQPETTLEDLVKVIDSCENEEEAFIKIKKIKNVPWQIANWFSQHYNPDKNRTQEESFHDFYLDIKDGLI